MAKLKLSSQGLSIKRYDKHLIIQMRLKKKKYYKRCYLNQHECSSQAQLLYCLLQKPKQNSSLSLNLNLNSSPQLIPMTDEAHLTPYRDWCSPSLPRCISSLFFAHCCNSFLYFWKTRQHQVIMHQSPLEQPMAGPQHRQAAEAKDGDSTLLCGCRVGATCFCITLHVMILPY